MKKSHILCAMLACASLISEAHAIPSSREGPSSAAAADAGDAAGPAPPGHGAGSKVQRAGDPGSPRSRARTGDASKGRDAAAADSSRRSSVAPQPGAGKAGIGQAGRGNADRLHSMLNTQARGHLARQHGGPVGSTRGATGGADVHGPQGVNTAGQSKLAASNGAAAPAAVPAGQSKLVANSAASLAARPAGAPSIAASPAARLAATPRGSAIGGPRVQSAGRVGGPAITRTTHGATIDGTQLHHK
jgi:hypothetical protein